MIFKCLLIGKVNDHNIKGLGLTDYTFIIKNPMDLGTVS